MPYCLSDTSDVMHYITSHHIIWVLQVLRKTRLGQTEIEVCFFLIACMSDLGSQAKQVAQPKLDNSSYTFFKRQILRSLQGHDVWHLHDMQHVMLQQCSTSTYLVPASIFAHRKSWCECEYRVIVWNSNNYRNLQPGLYVDVLLNSKRQD